MRQFHGRFNAHLLENARAVHFHGAHGDIEFVGDDLVVLASKNALHHFALAWGELVQPRGGNGGVGIGRLARGIEFHGADDSVHQLIVVEGLLDEIEGALLHGGHGERYVTVAAQENHWQPRAALAQQIEELQAAHAAHAHVEHQAAAQVPAPVNEKGFRRRPGARIDMARAKQPGEGVADGLVVVDDMGDGAHAAGSVKRKMLPPGGLASTHMRPLWDSTIERQILSPMPMPSGLVEKKGSNSLSVASWAMPLPRSVTLTAMPSSTATVRTTS